MHHLFGRRGRGAGGFAGHGSHHGGGLYGEERGGGRRHRIFDREALRLILLKLIADQPRHGYELIRELEERTGGVYAPSPGMIYPTLTMLEEMGLAEEVKAEGARKLFAATEAGRAELASHSADIGALFERIAALSEEQARVNDAPVRRAMGNLRSVLQHRFGTGDLTNETLHDIAALIDDAAQKIERL